MSQEQDLFFPMEQKHITSPNSTLIKDRVHFQPWSKFVVNMVQMYIEKKTQKKISVDRENYANPGAR